MIRYTDFSRIESGNGKPVQEPCQHAAPPALLLEGFLKRGTPEHPKVKHLCLLLNITKAHAVGLLELMWHFTAKYAPAGDIGKFPDTTIAAAVDWKVRSGLKGVRTEVRLSSGLVEAGFLDRCDCHRLVVHDWPDHADQLVTRMMARQKLSFAHPKTSSAFPYPVPKPVPDAATATVPPPPPTLSQTEWPLTTKAIQVPLPATDGAFIMGIIQLAMQQGISAGAEPAEITDKLIARAVDTAMQTGKVNGSAGLLRKMVPQIIASWAKQ